MKSRGRLVVLFWGFFRFGLHDAGAQISFAPATNYSAASSPFSVAAADINGDGKVDLISANEGNSKLQTWTNDGFGRFGSNAVYPTFANPESVVAADVNGDGLVDLICACYSANRLMVLTNNASGGFVTSGTYSTSGGPRTVIAADVNGDGLVDLISASSGSLDVFTNAGNGAFAVSSSPGVGSAFGSLAVADVNGDGKIDLIEVNPGSLRVLTNGGNGTFFLCSTSALPTPWPGLITTASLNGQGNLGVVVPDYNSGDGHTLEVLTNDGSGNFSSNATYSVGGGPLCVVATDVNGSGNVDLISANLSGTLTVLTNDGHSGFGSNSTLNAGFFPKLVVTADVNGDGKLDLVTANEANNSLSVLINNSIFPPPTSIPTLNINSSADGVLVSWPSASPGWSLQQNLDLTTSNWSPSGYSGHSITDDGTNKTLVISPPIGDLFFRLLHP